MATAVLFFLLLEIGIIGGIVVSEVAGYFWHRFVEHRGKLGDKVREAHIHHHYVAYPAEKIRRSGDYISSNSWSWYVLAAFVSILVLGISYVVGQLLGGIAVILCGALYGKYVINTMHEAFHISRHPLDFFAWFRRLRLYHDIHHLINGNYGIVFMTMDRVFGTFIKEVPRPLQADDLFPGFSPEMVERLRSRVLIPAPSPGPPKTFL